MMRYRKHLQKITEIRNNLTQMSDSLRDELYSILKSTKNRTVSAAVIQTLYLAQTEYPGAPILFYGEVHDALLGKHKRSEPYLYVLDIFHIKDKGVIVTGYIIGGEILLGDELSLEKADGRDLHTVCIEISEHPSRVSRVQIGKLAISEVSQGDRLVKL